ncbi:MAG TPA: efflux RND transporter periplasmic adaptor subunit [Terriglobales bacterium]|nr:efflux RND transporter periplasmic adaptor subunit [Terriglobales bacterium]
MRRRLAQWGVALALAGGVYAGVRWLRGRGLAPQLPTAVARRGEFLVTERVRGSLSPRRSVEADAPDITGLQIVWLAPRGSVVAAGQPLARFDSSTARQSADAKTAALRQAEATLEQTQATARIADQQDGLDLASDQNAVQSAELDASKAAILSPIDGAESRLALGMAREKLKVEQATIAAHRASNAAKIASAQRLRDKARADLELVQRQLRQMVLASPLTGVVNYLTNYSQGWLNAQPFKVGDSVWPNATLAEIPDLSSLEVLAKISEVDRGQVAVGQAVRMRLDALPELALTGQVTAVSALAEADFGSVWPPPKVFRLVARLDHLDRRLRPDMNGSVDIVTQRIPDAISVPTAAIFTRQGRPVVYVERGGRFQAEAITVQARNPDTAAVKGVAAGARVALQDPTAAGQQP